MSLSVNGGRLQPLTFTPAANLELLINLTPRMSLDCRRKLEYPERTQGEQADANQLADSTPRPALLGTEYYNNLNHMLSTL